MRCLLLPALCIAALPVAAAVEEQPLEDLPAAPAQTVPVELPPDIRGDVRSLLGTLGTQAAESAPAVSTAPADESHTESAEVAEPVPADESHAESAEVAELDLVDNGGNGGNGEQSAGRGSGEAEPPPVENAESAPATNAFDRLVAMYAENNGYAPALADSLLRKEAEEGGLSPEEFARKVFVECGFNPDGTEKPVEAGIAESAPATNPPVPAGPRTRCVSVRGPDGKTIRKRVRIPEEQADPAVDAPAAGDEAAITESAPAAKPPVVDSIQSLADSYPALPVAAGAPVINVLAAPNGLTWQGLEVEEEDLFERIGIFGQSEPSAFLRIQAFPDTPAAIVRRIVDAARKAGFSRVSVLLPAPLRPVP